jgi:hypothetical protein
LANGLKAVRQALFSGVLTDWEIVAALVSNEAGTGNEPDARE